MKRSWTYRIAYGARWFILVIGVVLWLAAFWLLFWPKALGGFTGLLVEAPAYSLLFLGLFLMTQALFLMPGRFWPIKLQRRSRPMIWSLLAAALVMSLATVGFIFLVVELERLDDHTTWLTRILPEGITGLFVILGLFWGVWTVGFWLLARPSDHFEQLRQLFRWIVAGSILETIVATGVFAWNPHNQDCFCARGSFLALVCSSTVALWCFGPGVFLLFMSKRYRRIRNARGGQFCPQCEYDLRGCPADATACPECGHLINQALSRSTTR